MARIEINREKCKGCGLCILYCSTSSIKFDKSLNKKGIYPVKFSNKGKCTGCSFCLVICPDLSITIYK